MEEKLEPCGLHGFTARPVCWQCRAEEREARKANEPELEHGAQIVFERIKLACSIPIHDLEANMKREDRVDPRTEQALAFFRSYVLGMPGEEIHIFYPKTWTSAFRKRFFPRWLREWFPIEWTEVREKRFEKVFVSLYPEQITRIEGREDAIG